MITQVASFKTSDGVLHESRLKALIAEQKIEIRGILQSDERVGKASQLSMSDASQVIISNADAIAKINTKYKISINRERAKVNLPKIILPLPN